MKEGEASSSLSQEKISTEETTVLTIENSSFVARLKRGSFFGDCYTFSITFSSFFLLALLALAGYIIYVYAFNYGNWDPNYRNYCNNNFNGVNNCG